MLPKVMEFLRFNFAFENLSKRNKYQVIPCFSSSLPGPYNFSQSVCKAPRIHCFFHYSVRFAHSMNFPYFLLFKVISSWKYDNKTTSSFFAIFSIFTADKNCQLLKLVQLRWEINSMLSISLFLESEKIETADCLVRNSARYFSIENG